MNSLRACLRSWPLAAAVSVAALLTGCSTTPPGTIQGALTGIGTGSAQGAVSAWSQMWSKENSGVSVVYSPDGGAAGQKALLTGQAHFAVAASPLPENDALSAEGACGPGGAFSIAAGVVPVGIAIKVEGIDKLLLDGSSLANILLGNTKKWNDPEIQRLNSGADLPDTDIELILENGPSDVIQAVNSYLTAEAPSLWPRSDAANEWPSEVDTRTKAKPLDRANMLNESDGGLSIFEGSLIGTRFVTAALGFGGVYSQFDGASVLSAVASGSASSSPSGTVQTLNGSKGYALAIVDYVYLCKNYKNERLSALARSFGTKLLGPDSQKNANVNAFVMSPSKEALTTGLALVNSIGETR